MTVPRPDPPRPEVRVLVVEDETRMRELLHRSLVNWGFDAIVARSGEEALRLMATDPADIVLLDLNLPGMEGLELLTRLRQRIPGIQAIVLTGFASVEAARQAVHLDVVEFLTKPYHLGDLEKAIDRAIRKLTPLYPQAVMPLPSQQSERRTLHEVERQHILNVLERNSGNRTATAAELGISRRTLYYKLEEYEKGGFVIKENER